VGNYGGSKGSGLDKEKSGGSITKFIPSLKSKVEDRQWARLGMVASVIEGDSTLALQQQVEDAGFNQVVVTPMGGHSFSSL